MSAVPMVQSREDWLKERLTGIGGSDAAAIVGLSPFTSPFKLFQVKRGMEIDEPETEAMRLGRRLEAGIAEEYAERKGYVLAEAPPFIRSKSHPFMFANLDRLIVESPRGPGGYEGKNLSGFTQLDDGVPDYIWIQCQHYMHVCELAWFGLAMLIGGTRLVDFEIERDDEAIDMLIDSQVEFMRRVESNDPPPMDGSERTSQLLRRMYPEGNGRTIILDDPTAPGRARQIDALKEQEKEIKKGYKAIQQEFIKTLGKNEVAVIPGYGRISYKTTRFDDTVEIDQERLSIEEPAIYAKYATTKAKKPQRRFLTKPIGNQEEEVLDNE